MASADRLLSELIDKHIRNKPEFKKPSLTSVYCDACSRNVHIRPTSVKFSIVSHEKGKKHQEALKLWKGLKQKQQFLSACSVTREETFKKDLIKMLVKCNIPIYKVTNKHFKEFIANHCGKLTPDESTLRKNYLHILYQESLSEMRVEIGSNWIYLQVDESTDSSDRPVVSVIVGNLNGLKPRSFLLDLVYLNSSPNSSLICQAINDALRILWPEKIHYDRVRLLVSDQAAYMLKASKLLQAGLFTKLLHISCLNHALHRVAEFARTKYSGVNRLVASFKTTFVKCPRRRLVLKESTQKAIPNFPVITRWGTWLYFVSYLADYLDEIEVALSELEEEECQAIEDLNESLAQPGLRQDLQDLKKLLCIARTITSLEQRGLTVDEVKERVDSLYESLPPDYQAKLKKCFDKNPSLKDLFALEGREKDLFRFAPLVSVDVERSFSHFKLIDTPQRSNLTEQHFKELTLIKFNSVEDTKAQ